MSRCPAVPRGVILFLLGAATPAVAQNLVQNGGFDGSVSPWWPGGAITYSPLDATGDAGSGSGIVRNGSGAASGVYESQCVRVAAGRTYRLGARIFIPPGQSPGNDAYVNVVFLASTDCRGTAVGSLRPGWRDTVGSWLPIDVQGAAPAGSQSASVQIGVFKGPAAPFSAHFDDVSFGICVDTPQALCLDGQRFLAEVGFRTTAGAALAPGQAVPLRADSGLFWFFGPENLELLVKVLNGCGLNQRHWVFFAATTNVGYTLTITDTATGAVKTYSNPLGTLAQARADTTAFTGCP